MEGMQDPLERLDDLMRRLIEADQAGEPMEPLALANELGAIRAGIVEARSVVPRPGGERHFRCESCGTVVHGTNPPKACPTCGKTKFFAADLESPIVDAGPA